VAIQTDGNDKNEVFFLRLTIITTTETATATATPTATPTQTKGCQFLNVSKI
jgi:hypothetical protein